MTMSTAWRCLAAVGVLLAVVSNTQAAEPHVPVTWTNFVKVAGQTEPIPEQWLDTEEARIAHNLVLPDEVAKTVPFDFGKAKLKALLPGVPEVGRQYFQHLCDTEAGEWFFKTAPKQAGIYNARPMRQYSTAELQSRYDLEAPVLQRNRQIEDTIMSGSWFVGEPYQPYYFVEEPRRSVAWQSHISEPYIRMSGFRVQVRNEDLPKHPMEVVGIQAPSAKYAVTWRGTKRSFDRENWISGMEIIAYDPRTSEVFGVRRQFIFAPPYKNRPSSNSWAQGATCRRVTYNSYGGEDMARIPMFVIPTTKTSDARQRDLISPIPIKK